LQLPHDAGWQVDGCMPSASLAFVFVQLWRLQAANAHEGARFLHQELLPLLNFMMQSIEMLIACEKELLVLRSILSTASCREPTYHLDQSEHRELVEHVQHLARLFPKLSRAGRWV